MNTKFKNELKKITEKRFTYNFVSVDCPLFYEEGGVIDYDDVVDLLNELYEENEQLKQENKELKKFQYSVFKSMEKLVEK